MQANNTNRPKDQLLTFRTTIIGRDSKDRHVLKLYMSAEEARVVYETIGANLENERGVKMVLHTGKKTAGDTGRQFDSTFGFISAVQENSAGFGGGAARGPVRGGTYTARVESKAERDAKIAALRSGGIKE